MCDSIEDFQAFGEGIYFYFFFLKFFAGVFALMCLFTIPVLYFLIAFDGAGFKSSQNLFARSSLSNFVQLEIEEGADQATIDADTAAYEDESRLYFYVFQGMDLGYSLVLWVSVLVFKVLMARKRRSIQRKCLTVQQYSLLVEDLPPGSKVEELKAFFAQFAKIVDVNAIFDFKGTLGDLKGLARKIIKRRKYIKQLNFPQKPLTKRQTVILKKKIIAVDRKTSGQIEAIHAALRIGKQQRLDVENFSNLEIFQAFVTLEDFDELQKLYRDFRREYKRGCCSKRPRDQRFYFKGRKLRLESPDLPSNINWENIGYPACKRFLRVVLTVLAIAVLLVLSTILVLGLTSFRESSKVSQQNAQNECVGKISLATYEALEVKTELSTFCFCLHQSKLDILNNSTINGHCLDFLTEQSLIYAKQIGAAVLISVVDLLFALIIVVVIRFVGRFPFWPRARP